MNLARIRKAVVAVAGFLATVVALNVLPPEYQNWGAAVLTFLTAIGVYRVPNETTKTALPGESPAVSTPVVTSPPTTTGPTD